MNRLKRALALCAVMCTAVSCGSGDIDSGEGTDNDRASPAAEADTDEDVEDSEAGDAAAEQGGRQSCRKMIDNAEMPEVTAVVFTAECERSLKEASHISESGNVLHEGVVGRIGTPVELSFDEDVEPVGLTFFYDRDELRGVPEENLIVLHYNENDAFYDTVEGSVLDTESCIIKCNISEEGAYLLADAYQWYDCWGVDVSEYEYDRDETAYESDWQRQLDTGDILSLADTEWAMENAPNFKVSTPEELAGAVWYVNAVGNTFVGIDLEADIDLTGYDWVPIGWNDGGVDHSFCGSVNGHGHTITGMHIDAGYDDTGFIGYGILTQVTDIEFRDCYVKGIFTDEGCTGIVGGQIYMSDLWDYITLTDCKVEGGSIDVGAVIGREAGTAFNDCVLENVTVNGEDTIYCSYREKIIAETPVTETFTVTLDADGVIRRDEHDGFRNLGWHFEKDGIEILDRLAENETEYDTNGLDYDTVYLTAFIDGTYIRVSNIIEK